MSSEQTDPNRCTPTGDQPTAALTPPATPFAWRTPCPQQPCQSYGAGHHAHWIQMGHAGKAAWGWRDGVVTAVEDQFAVVQYLSDPAQPRLWWHEPLTGLLSVGSPVRVHEGGRVLDSGTTWISIAISGGAGPVREPEHPELWQAQRTAAIVNLRTGRAEPVDGA